MDKSPEWESGGIRLCNFSGAHFSDLQIIALEGL